jgi:3-dehydroquinate synthase
MQKIIIENGVFEKIPKKIKELGNVFAIITDANLKTHGEKLMKGLRSEGAKCHMLVMQPGEHTKSLLTVERVAESLMKIGCKRDCVIIALGGGVIGDLAGFVASIYMRGVSLVSIPTTLLAMGDSSIGGKTGVDMPQGKNLLGTFYDSEITIMDPLLIKTIPAKAFRSGLAEIVKHAVIWDKTFFSFLEKNASAILKRKPDILKKVIDKSVKIKLAITSKDKHESVKKPTVSRMLLNYGHTVGHALEKLSNYELPHGEAISIGMVAENRVAVGRKLLKESDSERISALLKRFLLPTRIPQEFSPEQIKKALSMDKKNIDGHLYFALPVKIGSAQIIKE